MGILSRLFHRDQVKIAPQESARINEALERILAMHPRLRMARRYRERLAPAVAASLQYADDLIGSLPAPHEASADAWSSDPYLRAFFATPEDLVQAFSRSQELREHFERNADSQEAYAVLGMTMTERHVLGVALEGDTMRYDVAQTTVCFGDYRVRICGRTESDLSQEIERRLVDQLALEGLARLAEDRRELLAQGRKLLETRLALLQRKGAGVRSMVGGGAVVESEELNRVHAQIEENNRNLAALRAPTKAIDLELERVCEVLSEPAMHLYLTKKRLCIDLMNVVHEDSAQAGHEIEFHLVRIPADPPQVRAFALVRFSRLELLPGGLDVDEAIRYL
ncbi:hypothetical protein LMG28614_06874 [Paraburkholderia ultramafica]|uniref:Uncharacterized protein n=1 Tax=Paraburkholderia ultramafica TaxID=1544867 RepID=A0A6S7BYQ2_9BURK|nr:hypothetical protein [Paraburkholderia ultramafica]CAB3808757.1 hypothetical protein LMG28614_06874 [Paraburkholderia ultramafica]